MFRVGERVVCINNRDGIIRKTVALTIGKVYEIKDPSTCFFYAWKSTVDLWLINDNGNYTLYMGKRFITLREYRKQKLKKIL